MDVNKVKDTDRTTAGTTREASEARPSRQRSIDSLTSSYVARSPESVTLQIENNQKKQTNELRSRANSVINIINVADETAKDIGRLIKSIDGITEQAQASDLPEQRRPVLEAEANQLVDEIRRRAQVSSSGVKPLAGDEIRLDVDEKWGGSVKVKLPEGASEAFGLGKINLDPRGDLKGMQHAVHEAQKQVDALSDAIANVQGAVQDKLNRIDVAQQNSEASQASIRDVDEALNLAGRMGGQIGKSPDDALQSVGRLDRAMLNLLSS